MFRIHSSSSLLLVGVLLAGLWHVAGPSADPVQDGVGAGNAPQQAASSASRPPMPHAPALIAGMPSPFAGSGALPVTSNLSASGAQQLRQQFEKNLRDYQPAARSPEQKIRIKHSLHQLQHDPVARALMVEMFFSAHEPELAHTLYGLIRDADLKNAALVEQLIERDGRMRVGTASAEAIATKARIMDLIADLGTQDQTRYSMVVDAYLAQLANHPDPQLHIRAATQRIWYLNQHQPHNLAAQEKYLFDSAPVVRQEVYSLLEARLENQTLSGQAQLVAALNAALKADYPGASAEEKSRISALLLALTGNKATL